MIFVNLPNKYDGVVLCGAIVDEHYTVYKEWTRIWIKKRNQMDILRVVVSALLVALLSIASLPLLNLNDHYTDSASTIWLYSRNA